MYIVIIFVYIIHTEIKVQKSYLSLLTIVLFLFLCYFTYIFNRGSTAEPILLCNGISIISFLFILYVLNIKENKMYANMWKPACFNEIYLLQKAAVMPLHNPYHSRDHVIVESLMMFIFGALN